LLSDEAQDCGRGTVTADVAQMKACSGFSISPDGSCFRLRMVNSDDRDCVLELPLAGLASLMKVLPEVQQAVLPRAGGNESLRVVRRAAAWSLERDMADDALTLVLLTTEGFEWCFTLADADVFRMAECLRDERAVTLPTPPGCQ
jgi:hypothetical protein